MTSHTSGPATAGAPPSAPPPGASRTQRSPRPDALELSGRPRRGDPPWRRAAHGVASLFGTTASTRAVADVNARLQQPVVTGRRIAVAAVSGGAGCTTTTAAVGALLAARRGDPVLAVDADVAGGSLTWRLGQQARSPLPDLVRSLQTARSGPLEALSWVMPRLRSGLWLVPGGSGGGRTDVGLAAQLLSRLFAVEVIDGGVVASTADPLLRQAHSTVLVTPATPDGVRKALAVLAALPPDARSHCLVAVNNTVPSGSSSLRLGRARDALHASGAPVVVLPHDRHLVAGSVIVPSALSRRYVSAASELAAASLELAGTAPTGWGSA